MLLFLFSYPVTIGILGSTTEAQAQFKLVPKFVKKKTPLEQFLMRKVSFIKFIMNKHAVLCLDK